MLDDVKKTDAHARLAKLTTLSDAQEIALALHEVANALRQGAEAIDYQLKQFVDGDDGITHGLRYIGDSISPDDDSAKK